jgi:hypothetical protein
VASFVKNQEEEKVGSKVEIKQEVSEIVEDGPNYRQQVLNVDPPY